LERRNLVRSASFAPDVILTRMSETGIPLSTDLASPTTIPYFLWDEPMTVTELRERLATGSEPEKLRLLAKVLREARDTDVWAFTTPEQVARHWPQLAGRLGRRRAFWEFLLGQWRALGLLAP
jgi:hypothetical protein